MAYFNVQPLPSPGTASAAGSLSSPSPSDRADDPPACGTTLFQLELDYREIDCGMSYVIQTRNGNFFLIDGGYFTSGEEDRLYRILAERACGRIHISGWFFSHAHQDHVGNFINFMTKYSGKVRIDRFFYNIQPVDYSGITGDWKSRDEATVREFYRTLKRHATRVPVKILRTGDCFSVDELEFEVLFTYPDLRSPAATFNDHSTVLMMTVNGQKVLWLGDIGLAGSARLLQLPKHKLQCDIVQIAHHGYNGASAELYAALGARVALWPTPEYKMKPNADSPVNSFILNRSGIAEHIVGGEGTAEMRLPYTLYSVGRIEKQFSP